MIRVKVGDQVVGIPSDVLAQAFAAMLPAWLMERNLPMSVGQGAMKSAIKGIVPMVLSGMQKEITQRGLDLPLPDVKCPAAKANMIAYALSYFTANIEAASRQFVFEATGEISEDGILALSGLTATPATVGATETASADTDDRAVVATG